MKVQNAIQSRFTLIKFLEWVIPKILLIVIFCAFLPLSILVAIIGFPIHWIRKLILRISRRMRLERARMQGTSLAGVLVGLEDFYNPFICNNGITKDGFKNFLKKNQGLCPLKFMDFLTPDVGTVFFYYSPAELLSVQSEQKDLLIKNVGNELSQWRKNGQEIVVICDEKTYKEKDRKDWDDLTRHLQDLLFEIRFDTVFDLSKGNKNTKMDYIRTQLRDCEEATDPAQAFYGYIKIAEYIFHYRGLYALTREETAINKLKVFSMGDWNSIQTERLKDWKKYELPDVREAMSVCRIAAHKETSSNAKITYYDICVILVQLRNMYIGHGTMAYSVSMELLLAVKTLVECVIGFFEQDESALLSNGSCIVERLCMGKFLPCIIVENGLDYLFTNVNIEEDSMQAEYLNYENGDLITRGESRRISLLGDDLVKQNFAT